MPRRLNIEPALDSRTKDWVRALVRVEMADKKIGYRQLVELLTAAGFHEKESNLRNKVTRGELSASTLLLCLKVMGCTSINLERWTLADDSEWNIDRALNNDLITMVERDDAAGVYRFLIGELPTPVTVLLERRSARGATTYAVSHAIKTPELTEPHRANVPSDSNPERALRRAISGLTTYYQLAVEAGHKPADSWLIPSDELGPLRKHDSVGQSVE